MRVMQIREILTDHVYSIKGSGHRYRAAELCGKSLEFLDNA